VANSTYSFADVSVVFYHPAVGQYIASGQGIGTITKTHATEHTVHDTAADGSVMASKVPGNSGTATLTIQQTSPLHRWLVKWANHVIASNDSSEFTTATITLRAATMGDYIVWSGVSPQKLPDHPYQAQGQMITWTLMATSVEEN
jgi:hypothetical protein